MVWKEVYHNFADYYYRGYSCQNLESSALINSFLLLGAIRSPCRLADQCLAVEIKCWIANHWSSILPDSPDTCSGLMFKEQRWSVAIVVLLVVQIEGRTSCRSSGISSRARWKSKMWKNLSPQVNSIVKLNFKAGLFSSTFWFERVFSCPWALLVFWPYGWRNGPNRAQNLQNFKIGSKPTQKW